MFYQNKITGVIIKLIKTIPFFDNIYQNQFRGNLQYCKKQICFIEIENKEGKILELAITKHQFDEFYIKTKQDPELEKLWEEYKIKSRNER